MSGKPARKGQLWELRCFSAWRRHEISIYIYIKLYLSMNDVTLPDSKIKKMVKSSAKSFWEIKGALCTTLCKQSVVMNESRVEMV